MADNYKARITQTPNLKSKVKGNPDKIVAQTLKIGNVGLSDLTDVNASGQADGAMLIYNGTSGQYVSTPTIQNANLNIIGGTY